MFNMASPVPPAPPEMQALANLMALIADPAAAKQRTEQLRLAADEYRQAAAAAAVAQTALQSETESARQSLVKARSEHDAAVEQSRSDHQAMVASRSADLTQREVAVAAREVKVKADEAAVATAKADLATRLDHLRRATAA
jgi:hypothetical protein